MKLLEAIDCLESDSKNPLLLCPSRSHNSVDYKQITFATFNQQVGQLSTYLFSQGVSLGDKVLILVPPGELLLALVFALLRLRAIPVVIDPGMGFKNFLACARKTKPTVGIGIPKTRFPFVLLSLAVPSLQKTFILSEKLKRHLAKQNFVARLLKDPNLDRVAAVLFTSGSTGYPKGAQYTYRQFQAQMKVLQETFHLQSGEIDLPLLPVFSLYNPLFQITTVVPEMDPAHPSRLTPAYIVESIQRCQVTNCFGSPRLWTLVADYCEQNNLTLPSMQRVFLAGAPVHPLLLKRVQALLPNGEAYIPYGATEALPIAYMRAKEVLTETYEQTLQGKGTCLGSPLPGVQIRILPITNEPFESLPEALPVGTVGEIAVNAHYVSASYLNDEKATKYAKISSPSGLWHRMGDLGYLDDRGRLWFCGRKAERVVASSQKVYYTDCCESIFNACPLVFRSALIAHKRKGVVYPAIVLEPKQWPHSNTDKEAFLQTVRQWGQNFELTKDIYIFFLYEKFPVDVRHNAKIHRLKLAKIFQK